MLLPLVSLSAGGLVDGTAFGTWVQLELRRGKKAEESHCSHSDSVKRTAGSSTFPHQPVHSYFNSRKLNLMKQIVSVVTKHPAHCLILLRLAPT